MISSNYVPTGYWEIAGQLKHIITCVRCVKICLYLLNLFTHDYWVYLYLHRIITEQYSYITWSLK